MFVINEVQKCGNNYPKWLILNTNNFNTNSFFYYIITQGLNFNEKINFPEYLITYYLYFFSENNLNSKLNLSKLGTDYLINRIGIHYKEECTGSYPENYIFVEEPISPFSEAGLIDRTPLKRSYHLKK